MSTYRIAPTLMFFLTISLLGCGSEPASPESDHQHDAHNQEVTTPDTPATPDTPTTPDATPNPLAALVEGTYAVQSSSVSEGTFPLLGQTQSIMAVYSLATIAQQGDGFVITEQPCHYEMGGTEAMKPSVEDTVPTSLPPITTPIAFEQDGDTITYQRDDSVQLVGVTLDDPANDPLPTEADDERIFDQENDGNPGATASVAGGVDAGELLSGDAYFIQRQRFSYSGTRTTDGKMHGPLIDNSNQKVIDATNGLLLLEVTDSVSVPEQSTTTLVPLTGDYDCAKLSYEFATLFPSPQE